MANFDQKNVLQVVIWISELKHLKIQQASLPVLWNPVVTRCELLGKTTERRAKR